ncbi:MAG TPA: xanthine dehydrogenase molybdopterin binding subunit [Vicinamibacterales bacterium]|nr:xanthine dehydrogenase molybdopterin binding subunit [Vicinamibacterales bacterium]
MPVLDPLVEVETPTRIVRVPTIHDSAARQVSGTAVFIDDIREPEGTLHVAPGGAAAAHGRIKRLGLDAVRAAAGVVRVITPADIPGKNDCSPVRGDDPILTESIVDFHGQVLFAVVAETRDAARRAAQLAEIEIEPEPAVITVDQALAAEHRLMPDYTFRKGDSAAALAAGPRRLSGTMLIGGQDHFYLEGQIAFAIPREDTMFVHSSSQHPCEVQAIIAKMLKLPQAAVIVETRRMGGGFGGKETQAAQWASLAALAAWLTRRPCKVRLDRDDDMCMTGKRHDFRANYDVAFDDTGAIRGYEVMLASRCGYSNDVSSAINDRAMYHADNAYYLPATTIVSKRMKTHTVSNTAFRGFGGPQGMVAIERVIDAIAWSLALDPLDVRKRNFYGNGERDMTPYGMCVTDNVIHELVDTLEKTSDYRQRRAEVAAFNADSRFLKRGLALTPVKFGISFTNIMLNQAGALVHLYNDGTVHVNHGGTEMGQGLFTKVAQVVAEEFGIDLDRVQITATVTDKVPNASATAASSGSDLNGMAAQAAARTIKMRMIEFAAAQTGVPADQIQFRENQVFIGNRAIPFPEAARRAWEGRISLSSTGFYATPKIHWDRDKATGRPFYYFAYGAACAEVLVDVTTGEMKVLRTDILHDVGRSLNPALDLGQIEGAFVQGMGWLTNEELVFHEDGRLLTHAPSTYKIPCSSDVPADLRVGLFSNTNSENTIYRSKAVGEPPLMLGISVFAAIADALHTLAPGKSVPLDAPATAEAIRRAAKELGTP